MYFVKISYFYEMQTKIEIQISKLRERFYLASKNKESLLSLINNSEVSEQVFNSNAIENSTLSLDETEKILLQIDLDRYISERELFETKNLARVVNYINIKAKDKALNFDVILFLHQMLLSNIRDDIAGRFRNETEWVKIGNYIALNPNLIEDALTDMLLNYHAKPTISIIKKIATLHLTFEHIHPFVDGNGRIGRILNNYILIREGYVPINIKYIDRTEYYNAFNEFDSFGKTKIMENIVTKALTNSYHKRLAYLEDKKIISLSEYAKQEKLSHSNLINKENDKLSKLF